MDWEENVKDKLDIRQIVIEDVQDDENLMQAASVSRVEAELSDTNTMHDVSCPYHEVSPIYDTDRLAQEVQQAMVISFFKASLGVHIPYKKNYLFQESIGYSDDSSVHSDDCEDTSTSAYSDSSEEQDVDINGFLASVAHARPRRTITSETLSKLWRIDLNTAKRTLEVTSQNSARKPDSSLTRNYPTNDQMLRYRCIHEHFFMDNFLATSKAL